MKFLQMALLFLLPGLGLAAATEEPLATAVDISGEVTVQSNGGAAEAVELGDFLAEGDLVRTGADGGAHLVLGDGSSISLGPSTELRLSALKKEETFLELIRGAVNAMVEKLSEGSRFEVRTAHAVAAVKGTAFEVSAGGEESLVTVAEGEVAVSDPERKKFESIGPGQRGSAGRGRLGRAFGLSKRELGAFEERLRRHRAIHGQRAELMRHFREKQKERRERLNQRREKLKKAVEARDKSAIKDRRKAAKERFEKAKEEIKKERLKRRE